MKQLLRPLARVATIALASALAVIASPTPSAWAHAELLGATPGPNETVARPPHAVLLQFSEPINGALSAIEVWNSGGRRLDHGSPRVVRGNGLRVALDYGLRAGTYVVSWNAISATDGHATTGTYRFNVERAGPIDPGIGRHEEGWAGALGTVLARWIELASGAVWFGLMLLVVFIAREAAPLTTCGLDRNREASGHAFRLAPPVLAALLGASVLNLLLQAHDALDSWRRVLSWPVLHDLVLRTPYGQLWLIRQLLVLLALVLWSVGWWLRRHADAPGAAKQGHSWGHEAVADYVLAAAVGYALILAASGHAASVTIGGGGILGAPVLIDWVHVLASGAWVGGTIVITGILAPTVERAGEADTTGWFLQRLDRFSPLAYASVGLLALTGAFNAGVHLAAPSDLWSTVYGVALAVKLAVIAVMVAVSGMTVRRVRPDLRRLVFAGGDAVALRSRVRSLVRYLRLNASLGLALFLATAVMNTHPISGAASLATFDQPAMERAGHAEALELQPVDTGPTKPVTAVRMNHRSAGP